MKNRKVHHLMIFIVLFAAVGSSTIFAKYLSDRALSRFGGGSTSAGAHFLKRQNAQKPQFFRGFVGDSEVNLRLTRNGAVLSGTYAYLKIGKDLDLSGKIDEDGKFSLAETDAAGKKTGSFSGIWLDDKNSFGITLEGEWKKPGAKSGHSFYAVEQMIEFSNGAGFDTKTSKQKDPKKRSEMSAVYPVLRGFDAGTTSKFNTLIAKLIRESQNAYKAQLAEFTAADFRTMPKEMSMMSSINYDVVFADNDLASILFSEYSFMGGAHGMTVFSSINYDLKNNRELKLADLFKPNSRYIQVISDYAIADLKERLGDMSDDEWIKTGAGADENNFQNWNFSRKGLVFTIEAYQVAAYAAGPQTVIVPYARLKDILKRDGAAARFMN